ncbi:MAG TPA: asparaginase [Hyphomicrobiaceae bacterium]|nr:asparaginase [Hyphomicrobiaceae bacterium]
MTNPVLVELTRGALVESQHRGAVAVARPNGDLVVAMGDVARPVFPRSAVKSLQALSLIETGAADRYGFGAHEIALACASHSGTEAHSSLAADMLARAGLTDAALGCGAHMPGHEATAHGKIKAGRAPGPLDNNCSGKHSGMLATAVHMKEAVASYLAPDHPVQQRILKNMREVTGAALADDVRGIDGCSVPTWAMSLQTLATAFARLGSGEGLGPTRRATVERIMASCWEAPEMVAGPGRLDTAILGRLKGQVFSKTGAEGVYCAALVDRGLGLALKVEDGTPRAAQAALAMIIERLYPSVGTGRSAASRIGAAPRSARRGARTSSSRRSTDSRRCGKDPPVSVMAGRVAGCDHMPRA